MVELLKNSIDKIRKYLDEQEEIRDELLDIAHNIIRKSSSAMAALHKGDRREFSEKLEEVEEEIVKLNEILEQNLQFLDHGAVIAANREFTEAVLTKAVMDGEELPDPDQMNVLYKGYAQALAETVGELRRYFLDLLREDEVGEAQRIYERMESIFDQLEQFDYPDSILSGMKHRRDTARKSLEKTRADLTRAIRESKLERALKSVEEEKE